MLSSELISTTLELVGEQTDDLTTPVYERYFEASPESDGLMGHMDMLMRGRMLGEVINLLIMPNEDLDITLDFEVKTHSANGVHLEMYGQLFDAVYYVVRQVVGGQWISKFDTAWQQRLDYLKKEIHQHAVYQKTA